jgi:hypothetical protein
LIRHVTPPALANAVSREADFLGMGAGTMRVVLAGLLIAGGLAGSDAIATDGTADMAPPPPVAVQQDRITGEFVGVSAEHALRQIADATGADVVGTVLEGRQVTVKLDDVPLEAALQRILGTQSFSLVFEADGGLRRIRLINATAPAPGAPRSAAPAPMPAVSNAAQFMQLEVPISTVGPLAEKLGPSGKATMGQLFDLAARSDDAGTRVAAVDASMAAIERDSNLQGSIDSMLTGLDDQSLAMLIRSTAGERASELMSRILSRTRRPEFRQRIVNTLRALREVQSQS